MLSLARAQVQTLMDLRSLKPCGAAKNRWEMWNLSHLRGSLRDQPRGCCHSSTLCGSSSLDFLSHQLLYPWSWWLWWWSSSYIRLFATPWTAARQISLSFTTSRGLFKLMSFESMMPSNHLILCHPLLLLPSIFPSIRVFSSESALRIR